MSLSGLQKFFIPPVLASAAVFSALTIPLAALGDNQIGIKIQEEPFFSGKLRDIATPYVVFATAISLGAGLSAAAVCGWRHSSKKSVEIEQQVSTLEQHLQEKEELLKELKLSEPRLQVSGLTTFLDDEVLFEQTISLPQPVVAQTPAQVYHAPVNPVPHPATKKNTNEGAIAAASAFASAQTFRAYAQKNTNINKTSVTPSEFEELQKQLREMMLQMQAMQSSLQLTPQATNAEETTDKFKIYYNSPNTNEVRLV